MQNTEKLSVAATQAAVTRAAATQAAATHDVLHSANRAIKESLSVKRKRALDGPANNNSAPKRGRQAAAAAVTPTVTPPMVMTAKMDLADADVATSKHTSVGALVDGVDMSRDARRAGKVNAMDTSIDGGTTHILAVNGHRGDTAIGQTEESKSPMLADDDLEQRDTFRYILSRGKRVLFGESQAAAESYSGPVFERKMVLHANPYLTISCCQRHGYTVNDMAAILNQFKSSNNVWPLVMLDHVGLESTAVKPECAREKGVICGAKQTAIKHRLAAISAKHPELTHTPSTCLFWRRSTEHRPWQPIHIVPNDAFAQYVTAVPAKWQYVLTECSRIFDWTGKDGKTVQFVPYGIEWDEHFQLLRATRVRPEAEHYAAYGEPVAPIQIRQTIVLPDKKRYVLTEEGWFFARKEHEDVVVACVQQDLAIREEREAKKQRKKMTQ